MRYSWYYAGMWPYIGKISKDFSTSLQLQPLWRHPDIQLKTHKYVDPIFSQLHHELFSEFCIHWGQLPLAAHGNGHSNLGEFKGIAVPLLVANRFFGKYTWFVHICPAQIGIGYWHRLVRLSASCISEQFGCWFEDFIYPMTSKASLYATSNFKSLTASRVFSQMPPVVISYRTYLRKRRRVYHKDS